MRRPSFSWARDGAGRSRNAPRSCLGRALFPELLMRLFADSARLDCPGQVLDGGVGRRVREIVFALAVRTMLAHQPGYLTGHVLPARGADALWRAISDADRSWRSAARSEEHTSDLQSLKRLTHA